MEGLVASLHKTLPLFVLPVGLALELAAASLLLRRRWLAWFGIALLWTCSAPLTSRMMVRAVEQWAERMPPANAARADAIVVLSTGRMIAPGAARVSEWTDADRFYAGVELYQAGKAPLLVFTGGWRPGEPEDSTEGRVLMRYAEALGIPAAHVVTTGPVTNTAEEARAVGQLLLGRIGPGRAGTPHVLLVTTAMHMRRARALLEESGLRVSPFPVDFRMASSEALWPSGFMPKASVLVETESAWREVYGDLFYQAGRILGSWSAP